MHMDTAKYPHEQFVEVVFPKGNCRFHLVMALWIISMMIILTIMPASLSLIGTSYEERNGVTLDYGTGLLGLSVDLLNLDAYLMIFTIIFWITSLNMDLVMGDW